MRLILWIFLFQFWTDQKSAVKSRAEAAVAAQGRGRKQPMDLLNSYDQRLIRCLGGWEHFMGLREVIDPLMVSEFNFYLFEIFP